LKGEAASKNRKKDSERRKRSPLVGMRPSRQSPKREKQSSRPAGKKDNEEHIAFALREGTDLLIPGSRKGERDREGGKDTLRGCGYIMKEEC